MSGQANQPPLAALHRPRELAQDKPHASHQRYLHCGLRGAYRRLGRRVLYLGFGVDASTSAIVALAALTGMALFNTVSNRLRDRSDLGDQIADLSRGTADLARQVAEISRRLNAAEIKIASPTHRARAATDPLATEIGELGGLVKQIAQTVAAPCGRFAEARSPDGPRHSERAEARACAAGRRRARRQRERRHSRR